MTAAPVPIVIELKREAAFVLTFDRQIETRELIWLGCDAVGAILESGGSWYLTLVVGERRGPRRARSVEAARLLARGLITDWLHALTTPRAVLPSANSSRHVGLVIGADGIVQSVKPVASVASARPKTLPPQ